MTEENKQKVAINPLIIGILLVSLGFLMILLNIFNFNFGRFAWPFFIIIPGVLLIVVSLIIEESVGKVLIIPGSIISVLGILFLYQNTTNHWESWAYAWSLIGPASVGLGFLIFGFFKRQNDMVKTGSKLISIGLVIFAVGFIFFELIIGVSGFGLGSFFLPIILIGLGVLIIIHALFIQGKKKGYPVIPSSANE